MHLHVLSTTVAAFVAGVPIAPPFVDIDVDIDDVVVVVLTPLQLPPVAPIYQEGYAIETGETLPGRAAQPSPLQTSTRSDTCL